MAPTPSPSTFVRLEPRETTLCLDHFRQIANYIEKDLARVSPETQGESGVQETRHTTSPASSHRVTTGRVTKTTPSPTRIQPRRAAKAAQGQPERPADSTPSANSTWVLPTLSLDELATTEPTPLPEELQKEIETKNKRLRSEKNRRTKANKTCCTFGPRPWTCQACAFKTENVINMVTLASQAYAKLQGYEAPVAIMGPVKESDDDSHGVSRGDIEKWRTVRVAELRMVDVGGLRFALDVCDGMPKLMFISGSY